MCTGTIYFQKIILFVFKHEVAEFILETKTGVKTKFGPKFNMLTDESNKDENKRTYKYDTT